MPGEVPFIRVLPGVVVSAADGGFAVNVQGATPPVKWPAGYIQTVGDAVEVLILDGAARVLGPSITGARAAEGTVADAPADGTVLLDTVHGQVRARYVGAAPAIGTTVFLDWQATTPRLLSVDAAAALPESDPVTVDQPAPAPPSSSGTLTVAALDSGSWNTQYGNWSSFYRTHVVQGSYGGGEVRGAWFVGSAPLRLKGARVTGARVRLGARRRMGNYNAAMDLNLYLHSSVSRPAGDVTRVAGPHSVTLAPGAGPQWVTIPRIWGQTLVDSGGGIGVSGGTYGGVTGIGEDPASGQIALDWQR